MKVRSSWGRTGIKRRIAAGILAAAAGLTAPGCRHWEDMGETIASGEREGQNAGLSLEESSREAQESVPEAAERGNEISLPEVFDYREIGRMPAVEDQGELGTCWAFASLMAMESTLLPGEQWNFSEDHMSRQNSFSLKQEEGGQYAMSMAYLLAWQGPVTEAEDPYGDGQSPEGLPPSKHVQEIRILEPKDYQRIKEAIYQTGGVQSSLFTRLQNSASQDRYYNQETAGYYYPGEEKPNHNVVIIGWDDHYPKENFNQQPEGDGAFICLNSWGPNFGQEGCFYVSYYDTNIGDINVLYSGITEPDSYTGIYQSDLCGWIGQVGYGTEEAYFANTYRAERSEKLKAVGFYATMPGTSYQVYASAGISSPDELELDKPLAEGTFRDAGFYTVELQKELSLEPGEQFWAAVKIKTPKAVHPVAIEYQAPDSGADIDLSDGEGYLSADGEQWVSAERSQGCNLCLKAYTGP
ncbi:MAG: lectin like domain-containing protein [Lachnospiraceae bacterium]|nr:lectin like domain-containing protein [Lachnospiraceae bacterium]